MQNIITGSGQKATRETITAFLRYLNDASITFSIGTRHTLQLNKAYKEHRFKNMSVVLNGTVMDPRYYGYYYGYGNNYE